MARLKTPDKERAILDAASRAFAQREFHQVLIDEIAAEGGFGKGTIYRYFDTKDDLYFATILRAVETLHRTLEESLAEAESATERLERIATGILGYFWHRRLLLPLLQRDDRHPERNAEILKRREMIRKLVQETILQGIETREFRGVDARIGAELFLGMIRSANLFRNPEDTREGLVVEIMRIFLHGLRRGRE